MLAGLLLLECDIGSKHTSVLEAALRSGYKHRQIWLRGGRTAATGRAPLPSRIRIGGADDGRHAERESRRSFTSQGFSPLPKPRGPQTVIGANPDPSVGRRRLRFSKMTAPRRRRRCNSVTSSRDGVFSAPFSPRADPRVFCAAALVAPRLLPRLRFQVRRRALLPQLLRGSRRGTSASFEARCHLLPCIYPPLAPGVS